MTFRFVVCELLNRIGYAGKLVSVESTKDIIDQFIFWYLLFHIHPVKLPAHVVMFASAHHVVVYLLYVLAAAL